MIGEPCWSCGDTGVRWHCCDGWDGAWPLPCVICQPGAAMQCSCPPPEPNPHIVALKLSRAA